MDSFELRPTCKLLLEELNGSTEKRNIIKLGVDIQLPDTLYGCPVEFLHMLRVLINYLTRRLINGIISIEITLHSCNGNVVDLHVQIRGTGSTNHFFAIDNDLDISKQLIANQLLFKRISSNVSEGKIIFEFHYSFKCERGIFPNTEYPFINKKILLAEDNEINAIVFASFLEEWGCSCTVAVNGAEAVSQVHRGHYDGILMDIYMPVLNGNQATRKIRAFNPTIPIVALTASTREEDIREALHAGVDDYLLKPVNSSSLFNLLLKYL